MPEKTNDKNTIRPVGENVIVPIKAEELVGKAIEMKKDGLRLSQAHCSWVNNQYEVSYSFANDETLAYTTLRICVGRTAELSSISEIYPYAAFYENEMEELFGLKIRFKDLDYHNKLYRIKVKAPFLPEDQRDVSTDTAQEKTGAADAPAGQKEDAN
ncbi:MAG: NADH-quinone oxidoreductase subunit C [Lachnospiraceae bacterium]|jgi:ech hydrogenase subunit D|nr:NADH-quinone oxidoreductase subunit C [Lachnospiraceae bacterium]MCH4108458.1 NADH-quinone oxidoreductase subunit C [Lachnospiraceae bacterium]MCI1302527.1 NADH-quinone oxidoreductase subunit C [Lachnospiraceae bacterium]MCI1331700.1 NADH-quinone oxidoreductase subunit C [Lachnospiraceae bacterium]MCI1360958.1 NADH-quinone oxidoreductase subunit C [Lachnospiraceae bacterium]